MSFYRVVGALHAAYTADGEIDQVDLDLIVPATHPISAEYAAKQIACQGYTYASWIDKPTIEKVSDA